MPPSCRSTRGHLSPKRNVTPRSRRWYCSASTICVVAELEQPLALLDHRHLRAERGEHRRVLDADHAGADDDERARDALQLQDAVRVEDRALVEVDVAGRAGARADGDDDRCRPSAGAPRRSAPRRRSCAGRRTAPSPCSSATWLRASWSRMTSISRSITCCVRANEVVDRDLVLDPVALAVDLALGHAGQVEDGLAQRLGRDRARVHADAADHVPPLDDRRRAGRAWPPGSRPSGRRGRSRDDEVVVMRHTAQQRICPRRSPPGRTATRWCRFRRPDGRRQRGWRSSSRCVHQPSGAGQLRRAPRERRLSASASSPPRRRRPRARATAAGTARCTTRAPRRPPRACRPRPPRRRASPPSGPRSTTQSACLITSRLCSITSTVLPLSTSRCSTSSSFSMSARCRPVVGSSSM